MVGPAEAINEGKINHMSPKAKRNTGISKSNQKTKKPDLYSQVLDEAEQLDFELALGVNGIDDEIALFGVLWAASLVVAIINSKVIYSTCSIAANKLV